MRLALSPQSLIPASSRATARLFCAVARRVKGGLGLRRQREEGWQGENFSIFTNASPSFHPYAGCHVKANSEADLSGVVLQGAPPVYLLGMLRIGGEDALYPKGGCGVDGKRWRKDGFLSH